MVRLFASVKIQDCQRTCISRFGADRYQWRFQGAHSLYVLSYTDGYHMAMTDSTNVDQHATCYFKNVTVFSF